MKKLIFSLMLCVVFVAQVMAQTPPVDENGVALGGYDVVAYFVSNPMEGSTQYTALHNGATYRFATANNRDAFKQNPTKYLPQFDGYCAWGVAAKDAKFPINPETYDIIDGKLYLFFNGPFNGKTFNSSLLWNQETTKLQTAAHDKWSEVKSK
ncbi:MAG: YHS domain-containing (seleno)protein [Reichenbachiella sp.]|uniref:YHS domain-containing (seleno)protein n=1 Tax=Reichenbachiella sp. TaxID=2184521 RepID=UPI003298CDC0